MSGGQGTIGWQKRKSGIVPPGFKVHSSILYSNPVD